MKNLFLAISCSRVLFLISLAAGSILFSSCSQKDHTRTFFNTMFETDPYSALYRMKTESRRDTEELDSNIRADVTIWDQELREAYVKEYSRVFRLPEEEAKVLAQQELAEDEAYIVFIFAVETKMREWNRFDAKKGLWRITLEPPDRSFQKEPARIEMISDRDQRADYFYKSASNFNRLYRVLFNRSDFKEVSSVKLHISGPRGHLAYEFELLK